MSNKKSMKHSAVKRRESANRCASLRAQRSVAQQISILNSRLGVGIGAVKERTRLLTQSSK